VEDLVKISMNKPVRLFLNENTDTAANLQQEFVRIRKEREFEREAVVAGFIYL
jgi:ATP-dependent RNA helicase DDX27